MPITTLKELNFLFKIKKIMGKKKFRRGGGEFFNSIICCPEKTWLKTN